MKADHTPFENKLKDRIQDFEFDYVPNDWSDMEQLLATQEPGGPNKLSFFWAWFWKSLPILLLLSFSFYGINHWVQQERKDSATEQLSLFPNKENKKQKTTENALNIASKNVKNKTKASEIKGTVDAVITTEKVNQSANIKEYSADKINATKTEQSFLKANGQAMPQEGLLDNKVILAENKEASFLALDDADDRQTTIEKQEEINTKWLTSTKVINPLEQQALSLLDRPEKSDDLSNFKRAFKLRKRLEFGFQIYSQGISTYTQKLLISQGFEATWQARNDRNFAFAPFVRYHLNRTFYLRTGLEYDLGTYLLRNQIFSPNTTTVEEITEQTTHHLSIPFQVQMNLGNGLRFNTGLGWQQRFSKALPERDFIQTRALTDLYNASRGLFKNSNAFFDIGLSFDKGRWSLETMFRTNIGALGKDLEFNDDTYELKGRQAISRIGISYRFRNSKRYN